MHDDPILDDILNELMDEDLKTGKNPCAECGNPALKDDYLCAACRLLGESGIEKSRMRMGSCRGES